MAIFKTGNGESRNTGFVESGKRGIWKSENPGIGEYCLVFQSQISRLQGDDIWSLFRPILNQIMYIRLLNFPELIPVFPCRNVIAVPIVKQAVVSQTLDF